MAIYKPNNFYPYMQEVDLESDEGVIFSCQANTDGGSMIRAARLRILDKDNNIVLYEKIQNLDNPVSNGDIVEFKVEPYYFNINNTSSKFNFVSLSYNTPINIREEYCPYCLYVNQIYLFDYFNIWGITEIEENDNVSINKTLINSFSVKKTDLTDDFNNDVYEILINDINFNYFIITLKNNNNYVWDIELIEHEIQTNDYNGTFLAEGIITGSHNSVLWFDKNQQTDDRLMQYTNTNTLDYFAEIECNSNNSNFFEEDIRRGLVTSGDLTILSDNIETSDKEVFNHEDFFGNFYFVKTGSKEYNIYDSDKKKIYSVNSSSGYYIFGDFYERSEENGCVLKNNFLKLPHYEFNLLSVMNSIPLFSQNSITSWRYYDVPFNTENTNVSYWKYVENVKVKKNNKLLELEIDDDLTYVSDEICHRIGKGDNYIDATQNLEYDVYLFACRNAETQIIATDTPLLNGISTKAKNGDSYILADQDELVYEINNIPYRIKILNPRPIDFNISDETNNYYKFSDQLNGDYQCYNRYIYFDLENLNPVNNLVDLECFGSNINFNAVEDIIYQAPLIFYIKSRHKNDYNRETYTYYYDLGLKTKPYLTELDYSKFLLSEYYKTTVFYPYQLNFDYSISLYSNNDELSNLTNREIANISPDERFLAYSLPQLDSGPISFNQIVNESNVFNYSFSINSSLKDGFIQIKFSPISEKKVHNHSTIYDYYNYLGNIYLKINTKINNRKAIKLMENSVNLSELEEIKEYLYVDIKGTKSENIFNNLKIEDFFQDGTVYFTDEKVLDKIYNIATSEDNEIKDKFTYMLKYKRREKVVNKNEYHNIYNVLKFDLENPFDYYLNNNEIINIYSHVNKTTKNSFFSNGIIDESFDDLYIRFPDYDGKDYAGNNLTPCTYTNLLEEYKQEAQLSEVTENIPSSFFEKKTIDGENGSKITKYYKLFKITSYDVDTKEIIIAGGLERILLETDTYEIWKRTIIEGGTDYDITEVISTNKKIYPLDNNPITVGDNYKIINNGLKVMNTCEYLFFITPNINLLENEYNYSYIKSNDQKIYLEKNIKKENFINTNNSIIKLDNSQWLINKYNKFRINDNFEIYQDSIQSTTNYFYGRNIENLELYTIPSSEFLNKNLDEINLHDYLFESNVINDCFMIGSLDFYIYGNYIHKEYLKKYILKIYDENMILIYDSKEVYDSKILYHVKGLNNNEMYYMTIECENQIGNIVVYEQKFVTQYTENITKNILLKVDNDCDKSRTIVTFINSNNENCLIDDFINEGISENKIIDIYRRDYNGNIKWVFSIDLQNDKSFYGDLTNDYKYGFYDYNVRNDEQYEYFAVLDINKSEDNFTYLLSSGKIKTSFNSWTIVDIVEDKYGNYSVIGDEWSFRYNLESDDLVQNTSVTTWDTLGRYGQVGKGEKNFISSGMRCLLGDISFYNIYDSNFKKIQKFGYNEKHNSINNITKYEKWKKFCNSFSRKLLKDIKGNKWIVQIVENPNVSNDDSSYEQVYIISFTWNEIADSNNISICNKLESININ